MKVRLNTLIALASLAAFLIGSGSHVSAQTAKTTQAAQDPDLQAIRDNVLTVKGMFPSCLPIQMQRAPALVAVLSAIRDLWKMSSRFIT